MRKRRLIVGCGYLGRRVAKRWIAHGDWVAALTRSPEHARELRAVGIEPIVGDVTAPATLEALPEADSLLFAVGLDRTAGKSQREVYVGGLENVLRRAAGRFGRILYVSSTSVYGQNEGQWVDETSPCDPTSENGKVCRDAELLLHREVPEANILRLAGLYGPGRLVARVEALRQGNLVVEGNPEAWLNLIHVDDAATAVVACEKRGAPGAAYLVSDDRPCRRREYYTLLAWLVGAPMPKFAVQDAAAKVIEPQGADDASAAPVAIPNVAEAPSGDRFALNKRCRNRRLRDELQVALRYPRIELGLVAALTEPTARSVAVRDRKST
ncbi:MAG TPA: NAD-dependent epimerase/dehydratase family protein [Planctomycetaceae bacterium]|nr:NAD-dependent epimerase/dehydratase family protein [Planctomycetaceae bacterium]